MKKITFFIAVLTSLQIVVGQDTKKVLFLGNSYTASNDLPNLVSEMATSTGDVLEYDSNTPGGHRFINHASNVTTLNKINSNNWDFVTLQAQSQETSLGQTQMENEVFPYASQLVDAIRANNSCSQPLFYMTWGRENGDASNCDFLPWVCTYEGMDDVIRNTYVFMAEENTSEVSPVGAVWRYLRENHSEIDLYSGDGSHPSLNGSYAAACTFYTMIYKKDPTLISWNSTLTETTANTIKQATKLIVFDSINEWDFTAHFDFEINDNEVEFNYAYDSDTVAWTFGDGTSSSLVNPTHVYNNTGAFEVTLTLMACGRIHTVTRIVNIESLSIENVMSETLSVYPNPTRNKLYIQGAQNLDLNMNLYNVLGQEVKQFRKINQKVVSLKDVESGTYFLIINNNNRTVIKRIVKH